MKKIIVVFGTRPEAIKMAPVIKALKANKEFKTVVVVTAQHREMLDQVLEIFKIRPDYDLQVMEKDQNLYQLTSTILLRLQKILEQESPDLVMVHGDTTTSFVASLAAFYQKIQVAHVEAGLRTYNLLAPWPEEANRQLIAVLANYHFAPTEIAKENLAKEGKKSNVFVTGNTVIDALKYILRRGECKEIDKRIWNKRVILVTGHRRENFGKPLEELCLAIAEIAKLQKEVDIVFPVHLNPNVRSIVQKILSHQLTNVHLLEPLPYSCFIKLLNRAYLVVTDSGGVQEEAAALQKPLLILREKTERMEVIKQGCAKLISPKKEKIVESVVNLLEDQKLYEQMKCKKNIYGDGNAAEKIVEILKDKLE